MRHKTFLPTLVLVLLALVLTVSGATAQDPTGVKKTPPKFPSGGNAPKVALNTGFTYQGQLKLNGSPVNTTCNIAFKLFGEAGSGSPPTGGTQVGSTLNQSVSVANGLFTTQLDFGAGTFRGDARWLDITPDCGAGAVTLAPRQPLTAAPYALGLRPGTSVIGDDPFAVLAVQNTSIGYGVIGSADNGVGVFGVSAAGIAGLFYGKLYVESSHNNSTSDIGQFFANNGTQGIGIGLNRIEAVGSNTDQDILLLPKGSGKVGVQTKLEIQNSANDYNNGLRLTNTARNRWNVTVTGNDHLAIGYNESDRMYMLSNGNVGIGTTVPEGKLHVVTTDDTNPSIVNVWDSRHFVIGGPLKPGDPVNVAGLGFSYNQTNNVGYITALHPLEAFGNLILQYGGGNVSIGPAVPLDKLNVFGDIRVGTFVANSGCLKNSSGNALTGTCSSDERLKKNIAAFPNVLDKVTQLQPVYYNWRADEYPDYHFDGSTRNYGVIAQEVERVLPELVSSDERGFKTVNYSEIPLLLLQALKDLRAEKDAEIQNLKHVLSEVEASHAKSQSRIEALQKQNADLDARLSAIEQSLQANSVQDRAASSAIALPDGLSAPIWILVGMIGLVVIQRARKGGPK